MNLQVSAMQSCNAAWQWISADADTIDIVGTGGDGKNTFNISTASCFVVAGTLPQGGEAWQLWRKGSVSGASNVLEEHGVKFTADPDKLHRSLEECGVSFLHAPFFSPALKSRRSGTPITEDAHILQHARSARQPHPA